MSGVLIRTLLVAATLLASSLASPALAAGTESAVPAAGQRLSLADAGREIGISDQVISPDGKRVAVLISRVDYVDNRFASSLRVIDVESGRQLLLASERSRISSPRWSPSGNELAWLPEASVPMPGAPTAAIFWSPRLMHLLSVSGMSASTCRSKSPMATTSGKARARLPISA